MEELYELAGAFENSVVPQEYGIDRDDKRRIGSKMCHALLEKIKNDLCATMDGEKVSAMPCTSLSSRFTLSKQSDQPPNSHLCQPYTLSYTPHIFLPL